MSARAKNLILTGIPRSGTTLLTALVDSIPNAVALNEPGWQSGSAFNREGVPAADFAKWLAADFTETRRRLLAGVPIPERRGKQGEAVTNYYKREQGAVRNVFENVPFTRAGLTPDFLLAIKQVGTFLGVLPQLLEQDFFQAVAMIRNPVDVITSWRSLTIPPSRGQLPGAVHWKEMQELSRRPMPLLEKQVRMYDLMCARLHALKPRLTVIRHEDLLADPLLPAHALGLPEDRSYDTSLIRAGASYQNDAERDVIREHVARFGEHVLRFYPG